MGESKAKSPAPLLKRFFVAAFRIQPTRLGLVDPDFRRIAVIASFADSETEDLFHDLRVARFQSCEAAARRKLAILHAAPSLSSLRVPPGNRLEMLQGDRAGQHSIRINDQWRICFRWIDGHPHHVEICDYH